MRSLKYSLLGSLAGFGIAVATLLSTGSADATELGPLDFHTYTWIDILASEGTPRATILAATALKFTDQSSTAVDEKLRELSGRAARMAPDDAWVQWFAAINSLRSEILSEPALALQRLEPDNGAVWLFPFVAADQANDTRGVTEALARIGASRKFDDHSVAAVLEWLAFLRSHPVPERYLNGDPQTMEAMPLLMAFGRADALSMWNYMNLESACGQPTDADRRKACLAAGRVMLTESNTLDTMRMGASLLRGGGAANVSEVVRNADYLLEQYKVLSSEALKDPDKFQRYQADWLETQDENEVARNLLTREGVPLLPPPGWKPDPKLFWLQSARQMGR